MHDQSTNLSSASVEQARAASNSEGIVMRSDRGPTIAGTRINVYDIMDYLHEDWPPHLIRDWFGLTQAQIDSAMTYIQANKDQVEREYEELEKQSQEIRRYWEEKNRNRPMPEVAPDTPQKGALRAKLKAFRAALDERARDRQNAAEAQSAVKGEDMIVRTDRGLTIRGTRLTLYSIMDYVQADWPPKLIKNWLELSEAQIAGAMAYIQSHRDEVEKEYQQVLQMAEADRRYWEEYNRNRPIPPRRPESPERTALRAKFEEWKSKLPKE